MIVSLTTIPSRSSKLDMVIQNILDQTKQPDKIVLNVCEEYKRFPNEEVQLSPFVYSNVELQICKDIGPLCKIHAANIYDDLIVSIDDDCTIPLNTLELYSGYSELYPDSALCLRGRRLQSMEYLSSDIFECDKIQQPVQVSIVTGVWSACYHSSMLRDINVTEFCYNDDVVISGSLHKSATELWVIPNYEGCKPNGNEFTDDLWTLNSRTQNTNNLIKQYFGK